MSMSVRTVDFGPFLSGSAAERLSVAREIIESFRQTGFVVLVNHGIPQNEIDNMFVWQNTVMEIKELAPHPPSGEHHAGYSAPGREGIPKPDPTRETLSKEGVKVERGRGHVKETFDMWREGNPIIGNIWYPDGVLPGFKQACIDFFWKCNETKTNFLKAVAIGLDIPEDYFIPFHSKADNQLRLLHYLPIPADILADPTESRIPNHSDWGSITLLMQDDVGGLEVEDPRVPGKMVPIPPIPGPIVVNAGDFLMRWSNDIIPSTMHRVRAPINSSGTMIPERYSIPYFCIADFDTVALDARPHNSSVIIRELVSDIMLCNSIVFPKDIMEEQRK